MATFRTYAEILRPDHPMMKNYKASLTWRPSRYRPAELDRDMRTEPGVLLGDLLQRTGGVYETTTRLTPKFREDIREIANVTSDDQLLRIAELSEVPVSLEHLRHVDPQNRIVVGYRLDVTPAESSRLRRRLALGADPRIMLHFDEVPFPDTQGRFWGGIRRDAPGLNSGGLTGKAAPRPSGVAQTRCGTVTRFRLWFGRVSGFQNPVIPGFFPDPSVCRAGDEYFLVTSSFTYFPGVPVFRSTDLVGWTQVGNVLDRPSQLDLSTTTAYASFGVFAPTIRYHAGRFWMITTNFTAGGSDNFFVTAEDPAGRWSDPTHIDIEGVDPDLAWDDDGNCWVSFSTFATGGGIMRCRIDDRTGAVLEPPKRTWSGTGLQFPEAPHLYRRGDTWYLLIAEGGTERGHSVAVARGPSPAGPWEGCKANPILTHRSTDHPIQSTGHGDLVEAVDGSWWMVVLGTRPRGSSPGFHVLGRETFLVPVEWVDGWPVVGDLSLEMPVSPPGRRLSHLVPVRDDFDASPLAPQWVSVRAPLADAASLDERPGWLTLTGNGQGLDGEAPAFAGRRQQHHRCRARARVDPGDSTEAGLAVRMDEDRHYEVFARDGNIAVRARIGPLVAVIASVPWPSAVVVLRLETHDGDHGPDRIRLGYEATDGAFRVLADLDGRYLSTEVATGFTGRVVGLYVVHGSAAFDWFDYEAIDA